MKKFKIRASSCSKIISDPKLKSETLSTGSKSYCEAWLKENIYNRKIEFSSKYTQKGIINEEESIDFISNQLNLGLLFKNEIEYENEYITGTPDVILNNFIIDVKNSWDFLTFPLFDEDCPNKDYYWQAQCYMNLLGIDNYKLIYVLTNTPDYLIESEARRYCYANGLDYLDDEIYLHFYHKMTYNDIPNDKKIKVFNIYKNDNDIKKIHEKVKSCRDYIKKIYPNH